MIYILKYEIIGVSLAKHLVIKDKIEKWYGGDQVHIMPTTFLIKTLSSAAHIFTVLEYFLNFYSVDIDKCEIYISPLNSNRAKMKFKLDTNSEKWIKANIESTPILMFPSNIVSLKKKLQEFLKK